MNVAREIRIEIPFLYYGSYVMSFPWVISISVFPRSLCTGPHTYGCRFYAFRASPTRGLVALDLAPQAHGAQRQRRAVGVPRVCFACTVIRLHTAVTVSISIPLTCVCRA